MKKQNRKSALSVVVTIVILFIVSIFNDDVNPLEGLIAILEDDGTYVTEEASDEELVLLEDEDLVETESEMGNSELTKVKYDKVLIERVVDGDTFIYSDENDSYRVRLLGVNTPESVKEKEYEFYGKEASEFTHEMLENRVVYLEKDVEVRDQYGRELRYLWLEEPFEENFETDCFNALLISDGYAEAVVYGSNDKYYDILVGLEEEARKGQIGMWQ